MSHITEDIPRLLTGEANRDAVLSAAEHLRSCPDCQQELVSAVVAHASLTSAHRFAPEIVAPPGLDDELARLHHGADVSDPDKGPALPPMTSMFEKIRQEAEQASSRTHAAPRRGRLLAVAAAAVIIVGGGAAIAGVATSSSSSSNQHTVSLTAFDQGHNQADVTIVGDRKVSIDATKLPKLDASHVYELWLTDGARRQMWPVGTLNSGRETSFPTTKTLLAKYSNFEVSIQRTNQTQYSNISVLRGQYKT